MEIIAYLLTTFLYPLVGMIFPLLFSPIIWMYRSISKEELVLPTHPVYFSVQILSSVVLFTVTHYIWNKLDFEVGWLLIGILIVIHLILGGAHGANKANQSQAFGTVIGLVIYGIFLM